MSGTQNVGWRCPVCAHCWAPHVRECDECRDRTKRPTQRHTMTPMCGSVGCIGGHLARKERLGAVDYVYGKRSGSLSELFFPGGIDEHDEPITHHSGWKATAPQAARAIVNFLTLGDPCWDDVMTEA